MHLHWDTIKPIQNRDLSFRLFAIADFARKGFRHDEIGRQHRRGLQASIPKGQPVPQLRGKPFRGTGKRPGRPVRSPLRILATIYNGCDLSLSGLRRPAMRLRPGPMRPLRPRISFGVFVQGPPLLPLVPSEAGRRIRRMAVDRRSQESTAQTLGLRHTQTPPDLFHVRPLPARQAEHLRVECHERFFEIRGSPRRRGPGSEHRHTDVRRLSQFQSPPARHRDRRLLSPGRLIRRPPRLPRRRPRRGLPVRSPENEVHRGFVGSGKGNQSFQLWSRIANMPPLGSQGLPDQDGLATIDTPFPTNPR